MHIYIYIRDRCVSRFGCKCKDIYICIYMLYTRIYMYIYRRYFLDETTWMYVKCLRTRTCAAWRRERPNATALPSSLKALRWCWLKTWWLFSSSVSCAFRGVVLDPLESGNLRGQCTCLFLCKWWIRVTERHSIHQEHSAGDAPASVRTSWSGK